MPISIPFLHNVDMNQNQILNQIVHNTTENTGQPVYAGTPIIGQIIYTNNGVLWHYNGTTWIALGNSGAGIQGVNAGTHINVSGSGTVTINHDLGGASSSSNAGAVVIQNISLSADQTGHVISMGTVDLATLFDKYTQWNAKIASTSKTINKHRTILFKKDTNDSSLLIEWDTDLGSASDGSAISNDVVLKIGHTSSYNSFAGGSIGAPLSLITGLVVDGNGHVTGSTVTSYAGLGLTTKAAKYFAVGSAATAIGSSVVDIEMLSESDTLTFESRPGVGAAAPAIELRTDPATRKILIAHKKTSSVGPSLAVTNEFVKTLTIDENGHITAVTFGPVVAADTNLGNADLVQIIGTDRTYELAPNRSNSLKFTTDISGVKRPMLHFKTSSGVEEVIFGDGAGLSPNVTIHGNLTVKGDVTQVNSNEVNIGDNIIVLNADETAPPTQDAGLEVERGTLANVKFIWNESSDYWSTVDQALHIGAIAAHGSAATIFLTSVSGLVKSRTAAQVRSDIAAGTMNAFLIKDGNNVTTPAIADGHTAHLFEAGNITIRYNAGASTGSVQRIDVAVPNAVIGTRGAIALVSDANARKSVAGGASTDTAVTPANLASFAKNSTLTGNGTKTSWRINHAFNSYDIIVEVRKATGDFQTVYTAVTRADTNNIDITFAKAPAVNENYQVFMWFAGAGASVTAT